VVCGRASIRTETHQDSRAVNRLRTGLP
jgi:hypothetical protein